MKKLLLLSLLCIWPINLFAQSHKTTFELNDRAMLTLPHFTPFKLSDAFLFRSLDIPADTVFSKLKNAPAHFEPKLVYPRIILLQPPRIVVRQKYVRYGSKIIFIEPPQVIIYQAQIAYK